MRWDVLFHREFKPEFNDLDLAVQDELLAIAKLLKVSGPNLGRPHADTLNGSRHANMKELRFNAKGGIWRIAFAFDPNRQAILLVAGDKAGIKERHFYNQLISKADRRFDSHLSKLRENGG
jgi:hypothetical protein